jgi:hypothetical protein
MLRSAACVAPTTRVAGLVLLVAAVVAACGATPSATPSATPTDRPTPGATVTQPSASVPVPTAAPTPAGSPAESATPRPSVVAPTPKSFWAAAARGLAAAKHLQVTLSGPNPGVLRFEPRASATIVDGRVGFVCQDGAAYDGQSGFTQVPGTWKCGAAALSAGFRLIGQPADAWSETSPTDSAITEAVTVGPDGTWAWAYAGASAFNGGRVTATVRLDAKSGRILAARRVDPTGVTTYSFDYALTFPALAVPH